MQPTLNIAVRAARIASEQIARAVERLDIIKSEQQSVADFVKEVSLSAEKAVAYNIHKANPAHRVVGLHAGLLSDEAAAGAEVEWFVNPIDGLANFANGLPLFALTVVCREKGRIEHAVVINPITGEEFTASRGRGAQLNGRRIRVSNRQQLAGALVGADAIGKSEKQVDQYLNVYRRLAEQGSDIHSYGSVALTLAYLATGRIDACCLLGADEVDLDPGRLMLQEAGGLSGDLSGNAKSTNGDLLAANPKLFKLLLQTLR